MDLFKNVQIVEKNFKFTIAKIIYIKKEVNIIVVILVIDREVIKL